MFCGITKYSILDVAAALDPPLRFIEMRYISIIDYDGVIFRYSHFVLYQESLHALTTKLTIKQKIWKIVPKTVDETRHRTQVIYNRLQ